MEKIIWSEPAIGDLKTIYDFYKFKSQKAANDIVDQIISKAESLQVKFVHQQEPFLHPNHRRLVFLYFKIIYEIEGNRIHNLRIFDARQNPEKLALQDQL